MKKLSLILVYLFSITDLVISQDNADSIVRFSDLKYHSGFENEALRNYMIHKKDTFNLFLAIDDKSTRENTAVYFRNYLILFDDLTKQKIESKNMNRKIRIIYSTVHDRCLKKYVDNEFFPVMFRTGTYNCVTASILYALVFDQMKIPFKVMASSNHVYLIANPGSNSLVIETTNPSFEKAIFTGEFKQ